MYFLSIFCLNDPFRWIVGRANSSHCLIMSLPGAPRATVRQRGGRAQCWTMQRGLAPLLVPSPAAAPRPSSPPHFLSPCLLSLSFPPFLSLSVCLSLSSLSLSLFLGCCFFRCWSEVKPRPFTRSQNSEQCLPSFYFFQEGVIGECREGTEGNNSQINPAH